MRTRGIEDSPADPAAHLQSGVCGVDDGVHLHFRDVLTDDMKRHILLLSAQIRHNFRRVGVRFHLRHYLLHHSVFVNYKG